MMCYYLNVQFQGQRVNAAWTINPINLDFFSLILSVTNVNYELTKLTAHHVVRWNIHVPACHQWKQQNKYIQAVLLKKKKTRLQLSYCNIYILQFINYYYLFIISQSQWPRGLRRRSAAAHLLRLWVRIPPGAWKFVWCVCLCYQVEGSATSWSLVHRLWCVVACDLGTSWMRRPWPTGGCRAKNIYI